MGIRDGTDAHVAAAALQFSQDNVSRAETTLREIVSLGFVLIDEGSTVLDAMIGTRLVYDGTEALAKLYYASGRTDDADDLNFVRAGIQAMSDRASGTRADYDAEAALRKMPNVVLDEQVVRGIRWDNFLTFVTLAPCVNLNKVVFGPGQSYEQWAADAEQALVRRPSDELMFRFMEQGWFRDTGTAEAPVWIRAALRLTFGRTLGGSCAAQLGAMEMVGVL